MNIAVISRLSNVTILQPDQVIISTNLFFIRQIYSLLKSLFDKKVHQTTLLFKINSIISGLVYQISCRDCNAVYVGETGPSVRTRKREHADAVKTFNTKKSAMSQRIMDFDHGIYWDSVKILKSESHAYRRRVAESF